MKIKFAKKILLSAVLLSASGMTFAEDLFSLEVKVGGSTGNTSFATVQDLFDQFSNGGFKNIEAA